MHALTRSAVCDLGDELGAAELAALVSVDHLRTALACLRLAQVLDAALWLHRYAPSGRRLCQSNANTRYAQPTARGGSTPLSATDVIRPLQSRRIQAT